MRELLRRQQAEAGRACLILVPVLLLAVASADLRSAGPAARGTDPLSTLAVRITSPLGRVGTPGTIRIVAQVSSEDGIDGLTVRFQVDGVEIGVDADGPPFYQEWTDDNPFVRHTIAVVAEDAAGGTARDAITLDPFEHAEIAQVMSVLVETAVRDRRGRFVKDLGAPDFTLLENGVPQALDLVAQEAVPATFALLVDCSQSMARRIDVVQAAARAVLAHLRPRDRVLVMPFTRQIDAITGPATDHATVLEAIASIRGVGGTSIFDAVIDATRRLSAIDGRRTAILVTDGYDEDSRASVDEAIRAAETSDTTFYGIGIGGAAGIAFKGEALLRKLAEVTGGRAFFPESADALTEAYNVLADDAQNRYLITYTPSNQRADGTWRAISVKVAARPDDRVTVSRDGYFAPAPVPVRPTLEFTVTDLQRQYLDISRDDISVSEDGVAQKVDTFQQASDPVSLVLLLDASGSMKKAAADVVAAGRSFVLALRPADSLSVYLFADSPMMKHVLGTNRQYSLEAIARYAPEGGTALYDALHDALAYLKPQAGRRAIVVVTDGRDENNPGTAPGSAHTYAEVADLIRAQDVIVFPVGLGPKIDQRVLSSLAEMSGGRAYFPLDVSTLAEQYTGILENLRQRFVISYTSTNTKRDGGWRKVDIVVRRPGVIVTSRSGYFAPEK